MEEDARTWLVGRAGRLTARGLRQATADTGVNRRDMLALASGVEKGAQASPVPPVSPCRCLFCMLAMSYGARSVSDVLCAIVCFEARARWARGPIREEG